MKFAWAALALFVVSAAAPAGPGDGTGHDASDTEFVAWARSRAVAVRSIEPVVDDSDLPPFCSLAKRASVVALGEPAHGAHQPLELRNRIFAYLVEHCGFTAIAIETAFTESRAVYDYAAGGPGDPAEVTRRSLSWGFGEYAENAELVHWMHDYNQHRGNRRKVKFYGIDLSGADNDSAFTHPEIALDAVVEYVRSAAPVKSRELLGVLAPALDRISAIGYVPLARRHDAVLDSTLESLSRFLNKNADALIRSSTRSQYDWALQGLVVAARLNEMLGLDVEPERPGAPMPPDTVKLVNVRDAAMAANVMWARREEGKNGRVLVFAHNAHVMNAPSQGGIWSVFTAAPRMMGQHLRPALGNSLIIIGMSAAQNEESLPVAPPLENSVETTLAKVGLPLFFLSWRGAGEDGSGLAWLHERHLLRANFNSDLDVELRVAFDAVIFIDRLSAAQANFRPATMR